MALFVVLPPFSFQLVGLMLLMGGWVDFLQIGFAVEGCREGHVVQGTVAGVAAGVRLHPGDAVLGLVGRQLATQLVRHDVRLVAGQNAERVNHLADTVTIRNT